MTQNKINIIGVESCAGARDQRCNRGPKKIRKLGIERVLSDKSQQTSWTSLFPSNQSTSNSAINSIDTIEYLCRELANHTQYSMRQNEKFLVLGGDHSCAIGTWSGVLNALNNDQNLGLIWIDAHLDSHLPETSPSGAIHGMPIASLLGHGDKRLRDIANRPNRIKPKDLRIIGARSFEEGETSLLEILDVNITDINAVNQRGLHRVIEESIEYMRNTTSYYGISIDLDAIDPVDAPGVGSPAKNGLNADDLASVLTLAKHDNKFVGLEITELNPALDIDEKTAKLAITLAQTVF